MKMSAVVLSALELMNPTVNGNGDRNIVITEAPVQINDIFCNDDIKSIHTKSISTISENRNNLNSLTPNQQRSPTTSSIGSNNISIVTSDESENDTSVVDSDSDIDNVINYKNDNEYKSPAGIVLVNSSNGPSNICQSSILCTHNDTKPNIGSIAVQNSSDFTFGTKNVYQAPVTINNFIYGKNKWKETEQWENDNIGYENSRADNLSQKETANLPFSFPKKWMCTKKRVLLVGAISAGACLFLVIVLLVIFIPGDKDSSDSDMPVPSVPLKYFSRYDWNARPPVHELGKLQSPVYRVIIGHTAKRNCTTQEECSNLVRAIQTFHIDIKGFDDIGYNYLIGGDGAVYFGRGWDFEGQHTKDYNKNSIGIAFIGNFIEIAPPERQLYAAQKLIVEIVKRKKLTPDYKLYGQCQLSLSESPGLVLYEIIKTWDHWTEEIE